jgi:hypothetical protein
VQLFVLAIVIICVLIFVTNTKRWKAIGGGIKKSRRDLEDEIDQLRGPSDET